MGSTRRFALDFAVMGGVALSIAAGASTAAETASARSEGNHAGSRLRPMNDACRAGHRVRAVRAGGRLLQLDDGSFWAVDGVDVSTTSIWLRDVEVTVCRDRLINISDQESAHATAVATSAPGADGLHAIDWADGERSFLVAGRVYSAKARCPGFAPPVPVRVIAADNGADCARTVLEREPDRRHCAVWCE